MCDYFDEHAIKYYFGLDLNKNDPQEVSNHHTEQDDAKRKLKGVQGSSSEMKAVREELQKG